VPGYVGMQIDSFKKKDFKSNNNSVPKENVVGAAVETTFARFFSLLRRPRSLKVSINRVSFNHSAPPPSTSRTRSFCLRINYYCIRSRGRDFDKVNGVRTKQRRGRP
jgi:hypothetical protein